MAITEDTLNEKEPNQKHDEGYKAILSDKESFLYFLKEHIAEPWTANISIDDMTRVNKSFITDEYKLLDSDLIYKLKIDNSDVYFYVLVELQSQVDFTMPFRLLKYIVALLNEIFHDMDENVRARKDFKLPAIVPIILYNGDDKWTVARRFREYTKNAEIFGDSIIDFGYLLLDVKRIDKDTLSSPEKLLDAVFSFDKEQFAEDATSEEISDWWEKRTNKLSGDDKFTLFRWMVHVLYRGVVSTEIKDVFENSIKKGGAVAMKHSLEVLRDKMVDRFKNEGEVERALKIARNLKAKGMGVDDIAEVTGLTVDDVLRL